MGSGKNNLSRLSYARGCAPQDDSAGHALLVPNMRVRATQGEVPKVKKRPELVTLPTVPTVLQVSKIPTGVNVMRVNSPFTVHHLANAGVTKAFIIATTQKSVMTLLGREARMLDTIKKRVLQKVRKKYPKIGANIYLSMSCDITFGHTGFGRGAPKYHYVGDITKLMNELDDAGFSSIPLRSFIIPITHPKTQWVTFQRGGRGITGFIASQFGNTFYQELSGEQLREMIRQNQVLQKMKAYVCETVTATGKWVTCQLPNNIKGALES